MDKRLQKFADDCWEDFFNEVGNSVVYLDEAAIECLHWYTGDRAVKRLREAAVICIRELSIDLNCDIRVERARKAVFVFTSTDQEFYLYTLRTIIHSNNFETCIIFCAAHNSVLQYRTDSGNQNVDSYEALKRDVTKWMILKLAKPELIPDVRITFLPIFSALITNDLMVTPPFWDLSPPLTPNDITDQFRLKCDHFVGSLHSLFTNCNVKEDIYFMGNLSEIIADKLDKLPAAIDRRKRLIAAPGISLILIDRTLDLCVPTSHDTESLLGKIVNTLPRLPHHRNDVAVDMSPLCPETHRGSDVHLKYSASGCLASNDEDLMNLLINNKQKDVLLTLHKMLMDMLIAKEIPKTRIATRITAHSLEKIVNKFGDSNSCSIKDSSKKLQQIIAVIEALKSGKMAQIELMISLEKLILQNLAASRDSSSILSQISNIIKNRRARGLSMENLITLLIHIYALAGTEIRLPEQQENQLQTSLAEAIFEDGEKNETCSVELSQKLAENIMRKLHDIAAVRTSFQKYKGMMIKPSPQEMAHRTGILQQLLTDLLDPENPEIPDLRSKSSSFIAAGFNLLTKGRRRQHPMDNDCIIIYILGGITVEELKVTRELLATRKQSCQVILSGCRILSPSDVTKSVLNPIKLDRNY